jgi:hypothetical protein
VTVCACDHFNFRLYTELTLMRSRRRIHWEFELKDLQLGAF